MSLTIQRLVDRWRKFEKGGRLMGLPVFIENKLRNEIRVCASSARPELSGRYASLFIDQGLYEELVEDLGRDPEPIEIELPEGPTA